MKNDSAFLLLALPMLVLLSVRRREMSAVFVTEQR